METTDVEIPSSPSSTLDDVDCQMADVDSHKSSYAFVTPSFENHTSGIGSQLLRKLGYTEGGLGKNRKEIVIPIKLVVQTSRAGLGYDHVVASSPTPNCEGLQGPPHESNVAGIINHMDLLENMKN